MVAAPGRSLLFYSQWWPLGEYHNPEAERKAVALSEAGYEVVYVPGIGIRNPRARSAGKALDVARKKLRSLRPQPPAGGPVSSSSIFALPPRQLPGFRQLNVRWVERQVAATVGVAGDAIAWVRYPTPELVEALRRLGPRAVVYECVDAHQHSPGISGAWRARFQRAERELVDLCDLAVAPSEALAERLAGLGAEVRLIPHGVDVDRFPLSLPARGPDRQITAGFVGTIDPRIDVSAIRLLALQHPEWRIRMLGPVQDGFDTRPLLLLPNVELGPPVPHDRLGSVIASFDLGLMPYLERPHFHYMCPVKNLEYMAAGKPAIARPNRALERFSDLLYFAETPEAFCSQAERALAEDSAGKARRRRSIAEQNSWSRRLGEVQQVARSLASP